MSGSCQCRPDNDLAHRPLYRVGSSLDARPRRASASSRPSNHSHPPDSADRRLALGQSAADRMARGVRGRGQPTRFGPSHEGYVLAGGPSPHAWSASFTACASIPAALNHVSWPSTASSFWSPSTPRRPLASDLYGGVVTVTTEVWTSGYSRLRLSVQIDLLTVRITIERSPANCGSPEKRGA